MNESAHIPSIRGGLHQYHHRGPVETATAPLHYPGQLHPAYVPRGIGDQPHPPRVDGSQGNTQGGYHGLASDDGAEQSNIYKPEAQETGPQLLENAGTGIGQPLPGSVADYMRQGQYTGDRQQFESEQSVSDMQANRSSTSPPVNPFQTISGQKRNAVGDIKSPSADIAPPDHGVDGSRHRSRSTSSASHENRIAALSAQLRTRLSHAAAKVEKNRQSRSKSPLHMLQGASSALPPTEHGTQLIVSSGLKDPPDRNTVSALTSSATHSHHPLEILPFYPNSHSAQSTLQSSPRKLLHVPKLAPPVDIVSGWGSGRRRLPNPNEWAQTPQDIPSRHRRYHSQLEFGASKPYSGHDSHAIPGTPSLRPSYEYPTSTPYDYARLQTDSQESSMEQDAIETLLLMSSPENFGYRSNARQRQNTISNSIDSSMGSGSSASSNQFFNPHMNTHYHVGSSALESQTQSRHSGLEAQAGDEIDRMLDQMGDSDSEDEKKFASAHSRSHTVPANHSRRSNGLSGS